MSGVSWIKKIDTDGIPELTFPKKYVYEKASTNDKNTCKLPEWEGGE